MPTTDVILIPSLRAEEYRAHWRLVFKTKKKKKEFFLGDPHFTDFATKTASSV